MKNKNTARHTAAGVKSTTSNRREFESRLGAYATAGKAALAVGAAVGATAVANGQIINLTSSSFSGTPTTVGGSVAGRAAVPGAATASTYHKQQNAVGFLPFGGNLNLRVGQYNSNGSNASSHPVHYALGVARLLVSANANPQWARAGGPYAINFINGAAVNASNWTHTARVFYTHGSSPTNAAFNVGQKKAGVQFNLGIAGYLGFRVRKSVGHYYFGWMKVVASGNGDGRPVSLALVANGSGVYGAYNSTLDGPVNVGQFTAIPEPSGVAAGLALFALGAVGVREHRRRKRAA